MFRILILISVIVFYQHSPSAQLRPVTFEDLKVLQKNEPKPVAVLIMTSWCKYCHSMKNTMLKNKEVSAILTDKFYVIFLDAEEKKEIFYAGRKFKYKAAGLRSGFHELAEQLGTINGQVTYPSLCFLNEKNEIIYQHEGFLKPASLALLLKSLDHTNTTSL